MSVGTEHTDSRSATWPGWTGTGIGSLPGLDVEGALRQVAELLPDLPHQPELPDRGPAAGIIGRGVALLVDLPAQWSVRGWQVTSRPGVDVRRARSLLARDGDLTEQIFASYDGWFKCQVVGPVTLAAELETARGHRALTDAGARRDLEASLTEGVSIWIAEFGRRLPKAKLLLQIDEPALPAALAGTLTTASGWGSVKPVPGPEVESALTSLVQAVNSSGAATAIHSCASSVPVDLLARTGVDALSLDLHLLDQASDEDLGSWIEANGRLMAGVPWASSQHSGERLGATLEPVTQLWARTGLSRQRLQQVTVTPTCGLAGSTETDGGAAYRAVVAAGRRLRDEAEA